MARSNPQAQRVTDVPRFERKNLRVNCPRHLSHPSLEESEVAGDADERKHAVVKAVDGASLAVVRAILAAMLSHRGRVGRGGLVALKTKHGRKNVKSARYRPILSANRRMQRLAHAYARADPAPNGQNGGNCAGK